MSCLSPRFSTSACSALHALYLSLRSVTGLTRDFLLVGKKVSEEDVSELPEVDQNTKKQLRQRKSHSKTRRRVLLALAGRQAGQGRAGVISVLSVDALGGWGPSSDGCWDAGPVSPLSARGGGRAGGWIPFVWVGVQV